MLYSSLLSFLSQKVKNRLFILVYQKNNFIGKVQKNTPYRNIITVRGAITSLTKALANKNAFYANTLYFLGIFLGFNS